MKFEIRKDLAAVAGTIVATYEVLEKEPDNMNYWDPKTEAFERASQLVGRYAKSIHSSRVGLCGGQGQYESPPTRG
jgi:hypothetical protein